MHAECNAIDMQPACAVSKLCRLQTVQITNVLLIVVLFTVSTMMPNLARVVVVSQAIDDR